MDKKSILVAEDQALIRGILEMILSQEYEVTMCEDGEEAMETWMEGRDKFDLLLTDIGMPRMNGKELIRAIRYKGSGIPILVYSADPLEEPPQGADEFLKKPAPSTDILAAVRSLLAGMS